MLRVLQISCVLMVVLGGIPQANAADDVFTVPRVSIDSKGESSAAARDVALNEGRVVAFTKLLQRLTAKSSWGTLPQFTAEELDDVVLGIEISNEKTSSIRYLADVTYSFQPDAVRDLLRRRSIPFSESQSRAAVVLPLYDTGQGIQLWEDDNPWAKAWQNKRLTHELVPLLAPLGGVEDLMAISTDDAVNGDRTRLRGYAQKYNVEDVLIAYARLQERQSVEELSVRLTRFGGQGVSAQASTTDLVVRNTQQLPVEDLMDFAIDQGVERLQSAWKSQTIVRSDGVTRTLRSSVQFKKFSDWLDIRDGLQSLPMVQQIDVTSLSLNGADIVVRHVGSFDQLKFTLAQENVQLVKTARGSIMANGNTVIDSSRSSSSSAAASSGGMDAPMSQDSDFQDEFLDPSDGEIFVDIPLE